MTESPRALIDAELQRLAALRMQMLEMHPFWGYILLQVRLVPTFALPTMATDCVSRIWFNPDFTSTLETKELGFVLAHEVCHQVFESNARQEKRDPHKWNLATDYAINDLVSGITVPGAASDYRGDVPRLYQMPRDGLLNRRYHGMIAETIYEDLCTRKIAPPAAVIAVKLETGDRAAVDFPSVPWRGGSADVHLPLELDAERREILRDRVRAAVESYHASADRGDLPGDWLRRIEGVLSPPKIPWQRVLHRYADVILHRDDYSLACPNKRFMVHDLVVPGHYSETLDRLVVALDTSASMEPDDIQAVLSELLGMVGSSREITLIVADAEVRQVVSGDELETFVRAGKFGGGGGTDHCCVFEYIDRHRLRPGVFVGLTDLYSLFPEKKPPYPVLWVAPDIHGTPPWGKVIEL